MKTALPHVANKFYADRKAAFAQFALDGLPRDQWESTFLTSIGAHLYVDYTAKATICTAGTGTVHKADLHGWKLADGTVVIGHLGVYCGAHRRHQSGGRSSLRLVSSDTPCSCKRCGC